MIRSLRNLLANAEFYLSCLILAGALAIFLSCHGCNSAQIAVAESAAHKAAVGLQVTIQAYRANEATIDEVLAKATQAAPQIGSGPLQAAAMLKAHTGTIDLVEQVAAFTAKETAGAP